MGRPGPGGNPEGDSPDNAYSRGRPVTDNVGAVGAVLRRDGGFGEADGVGRYIMAEGNTAF